MNCAFGLVSCRHRRTIIRALIEPMPAPAEASSGLPMPMHGRGDAQARKRRLRSDRMRFEWSIDLRYRRQVHQVTTPLRGPMPYRRERSRSSLAISRRSTSADTARARPSVHAGIEMTTFRLTGARRDRRPIAEPSRSALSDPCAAAVGPSADLRRCAGRHGGRAVYDFGRLRPGNARPGSGVIHTPITTIVRAERATRTDGWTSQCRDRGEPG